MESRRLNRLVIIQQPTSGQDAAGQPVLTWTNLASVWANIRYMNGIESIKAGAETSVAKASIRIRYRSDVTPAMRVSIGETVFQIKAVLPDEASKQYADLSVEVLS